MAKTSTGYVQCEAITASGTQCRAAAMAGSKYCFMHDPAQAAARAAARSRGGKARHGRKLAGNGPAVTLATVGDVVSVLEDELSSLLTLEVSVSRARAVAYLGSVAARALEVSVFEPLLAEIEAAKEREHE